MSKPPEDLYLVWRDGSDEQYYSQYYTFLEAVQGAGPKAKIFKADLKLLGKFEVVKLVKKVESK